MEQKFDTLINYIEAIRCGQDLLEDGKPPPLLLSEKEIEETFGISSNTLRQSRQTGYLWGEKAPKYLKFGTKQVRYKLSEIVFWLDSKKEIDNTSQDSD